jgi:hypothetical protein
MSENKKVNRPGVHTYVVTIIQAIAIPSVSDDDLLSLQRQLDEVRENLRLIQERKAEFVLSIEIPLQLVKEEQRLLYRIAELEQQIAARSASRSVTSVPEELLFCQKITELAQQVANLATGKSVTSVA